MSTLRIAVLQHDIVWGDRQANFHNLNEMVKEASDRGAQLALLSETFSTGYDIASTDLPEPEDGPALNFLREAAARSAMTVGGSFALLEKDGIDSRPFNSFVLAKPNGEFYRYDKRHPFTYGGEDRHFRSGDKLTTIESNGLRLSPFVCYDLRFGNEMWQLATQTDAYLFVANWPRQRQAHWTALLKARAIENQAYTVGVNRVGNGGGLRYVGGSAIYGPNGETIVEAGSDQQVLIAEISSEVVASARAKFGFLNDRLDL